MADEVVVGRITLQGSGGDGGQGSGGGGNATLDLAALVDKIARTHVAGLEERLRAELRQAVAQEVGLRVPNELGVRRAEPSLADGVNWDLSRNLDDALVKIRDLEGVNSHLRTVLMGIGALVPPFRPMNAEHMATVLSDIRNRVDEALKKPEVDAAPEQPIDPALPDAEASAESAILPLDALRELIEAGNEAAAALADCRSGEGPRDTKMRRERAAVHRWRAAVRATGIEL